ncbi:glycosyltransferase [Sutcliffiella horikoshii]|uniref:Glycosyltransferase family 4 protein n=1 Tax=Sutcliffiella horikoshii TaxID=79883 RepID=A0AA94WQW2_9BACI|nr:glycosyltransferase [Sutcliffiella horikoshii]TYS61119.1 glycosyltransferase family 4 protein [Sutcliffiella horikoshii]
MKKKVCILVDTHSFLDARIFKKQAKSLYKAGYDVTLIVPRRDGFLYDVDGTPFTNKFLKKNFIHEGINIITYNRKKTSETLKEITQNITKKQYLNTTDPLAKLGIEQNADIYHCHELFSLYSGVCIKEKLFNKGKKNVKLIYDSHEVYPDPFIKLPLDRHLLYKKMLVILIKHVDFTITVSEAIKSWFLAMNPTQRVEVIYNTPPFSNKTKKQLIPNKNDFILCHEGSISKERGNFNKIVEMTKASVNNIDFKFKIIGGIKTGTSLPVPKEIKENIIQTGWVKYEEIPSFMDDVDLGWVDNDLLELSLNRTFALPNKFFSYLNNGVPVLVNKCYEMEKFIRTYKCGIVIDKFNVTGKEYADAISYFVNKPEKLRQMSDNALRVMEKVYCWEKMEEKLYYIYEFLLTNKTKYIY